MSVQNKNESEIKHVDLAVSPLTGSHVVVVGGGSGLGLATAVGASAAGAVVTVISHSEQSVHRAKLVLPAGAAVLMANSLDSVGLDKIFSEGGFIDHLVFTAADKPLAKPITTLAVKDVRSAFEVRYFGALTTIQAAVPYLRSSGSITLTSGAATVRPHASSGVLASICGAMEGLTRALAVELSPIRVNVVRPGFTRSGLWSHLDESAREALYKQAAETNLVRHVGETDELARAYLYCMTQTYATGTVQAVDGGYALV